MLFYQKTHPDKMGEAQVARLLTHLAVERHVSLSTQNQALNALVFLYMPVIQRGGRAVRSPLGGVLACPA